MFNSLRKSFIRMNMLVISLLMLASFCVVYVLVYTNTQREIRAELNMLLTRPDMSGDPRQEQFQEKLREQFFPDEPQPQDNPQAMQPQDAPQFANVPRIGFVARVTETGYETAQPWQSFVPEGLDVAAMLEQADGDSGSFSMGEYTWTYQTRPDGPNGTKIAFVETGESRAILGNLVKMFALIAAVLLVAIWFVSRWFAKRSVAPIEEAYNSQRRFIQDASHDLKTPVAVVKTNLELLRSHPEEPVASQGEWLDNMQMEVRRMEHMTAQLLSLARAESDAPNRQKEHFSLTDAVEQCTLPMEAVMYEKSLHFSEEVAGGIFIQGYPDDIERLVHILIENAIQYTPENGTISLSLRAEKRRAVLRVSNSGAGIAKEDLPHIFERFYRGDEARSREKGSYGLGLSIAQGIVQRNRGSIAAESGDGLTVFTVKLPLQ